MKKTVDQQIRELQNAKSKWLTLKSRISACNSGINLLSKNGKIVKGKPSVRIKVSDEYVDGDYYHTNEIYVEQPAPEVIQFLIKVFETEKKSLQAELDELESQYSFDD